jgi:hypothetical protein
VSQYIDALLRYYAVSAQLLLTERSCCYLCFAMISGALVFAFAIGVLSRTAVRNVLPVPYTALVSFFKLTLLHVLPSCCFSFIVVT